MQLKTGNGVAINTGTFATSISIKLAVNGSISLGSNYTAGDSQLNLLDGTAGSTQVSMRFGNTLTSNDCMTLTWTPNGSGSATNALCINPYGTSNDLCITTGHRVGIDTSSPVAPLQVSLTVSYTWNSANSVGLNGYRLRTDSGVTETATGTAITYTNVCAIFNGYIGCEAMVMQSDRRLKQDIEDVQMEWVSGFYRNIKVKSYR